MFVLFFAVCPCPSHALCGLLADLVYTTGPGIKSPTSNEGEEVSKQGSKIIALQAAVGQQYLENLH